jgi:signal transduction histidine kinase
MPDIEYSTPLYDPSTSFGAMLARGSSEQQRRIIDALYRVNSLMTEVTDLHTLLDLILNESKQVTGVDASSLMLYDQDKDELYFEVALGEKGEKVKVIRLKTGEGIAGTCAKERTTIVVNDVAHDDRHYKRADAVTEFHTRNILSTPLICKDRLVGVLQVLNKADGQPFTDADVKVTEFFADHAAIAIENALLVKANLRAERLAALGQAVASISHYVKNILSGIKGGASLIDHGLSISDLEMIRKVWPILQRSNAKIFSLVQDMLTYSKEREPALKRANVNALADDIYQMVMTSAAEAGVLLEIQPAPEMPDSLFDLDRMHDAVLNVVSNAIDATQNQTQPHVRISTAWNRDTGRMTLTIEDNGPGIPDEIQKKIFDPFFSTKGSKGTGLGLAVSQKVCRENGGEILLDSAPGQGARFTICLPYRPVGDGGDAVDGRKE